MKNITVSIDERTYRRARIRAAELETSVSALVRDYLNVLVAESAGEERAETADERRRRLLKDVIEKITANGGGLRMSENQTREELYDEAINGPDAIR